MVYKSYLLKKKEKHTVNSKIVFDQLGANEKIISKTVQIIRVMNVTEERKTNYNTLNEEAVS